MNKLKRVSALVFAGMSLMWATQPSHALGFGRPFSRAILGDTLSVTVPLRVEPGEDITDECLAADVYFGDDKVAASAVSAVLQEVRGGELILKVSTTALVNEPVVTVYLAAGCQARITLKFVAFADPPGMVMPSAGDAGVSGQLAGIDGATTSQPERKAGSGKNALASGSGARRSASSTQAGASGKRSTSQADAAQLADSAAAPLMVARAARVAPEPEGDVRPSQRARMQSSLRAEQGLDPANRGEAGGGGRLVLDSVEPDPLDLPELRMTSSMGIMLQADDQSPEVMTRRRTAAALWLALNATPEEMARDRQRIGDLEKRLAELSAENLRTKQALAAAEGLGGSGKWLILLGVIAAAAVGVAVYLARKLKSGEKGKQAWWQSQAEAPQREPTDAASALERTAAFVRTPDNAAASAGLDAAKPAGVQMAAAKAVPTRPAMPPAPSVLSQPTASLKQKLHAAVPDAPVTPMVATQAPAALVSQSAEPLREVSVEELIDLEQQAEFFVVLGQDDAAISLLESHVASTTGASPLPSLKLLEIYRRLGRRDDYERVQVQFNLRFNAHAPSWDAEPQQGHVLEDYPGVVERLQALWATPAKAMEVLEKSLTRPDASTDTFELSAYRELLFLYAVARDLSERELHDRSNIDLLLPSLDGGLVDNDAGPTTASNGEELRDTGEPLMATRPIKAQPEALPSLSLDFHLDDLPEAKDAVKH